MLQYSHGCTARSWGDGSETAEGDEALRVANGSQQGQDFITALEGSGRWIYGFNSILETQTLNAELVWNGTGTDTRSIWSGSELKGLNPLGSLFGLANGIFINNGLTDLQAVETIYHEYYHYTDPKEAATRLATTQFLQAIGVYQSQIPGAITPTGQINAATVRASAPPYTTTVSRTGSASGNISGLNGFLPGHP